MERGLVCEPPRQRGAATAAVDLIEVLRRSDVLRMEPSALVDLERELELRALYGGEVLFSQGDAGDSMYIVVSGRLRVVHLGPDGSERLLAELGPGETVGEMAVLSGEVRSATVCAMRDTQVAKLTAEAVRRVMRRHPDSMLAMITSRLVSRVRTMSSGVHRRADVTTIAIAPAGRGVPLHECAAAFSRALLRLGSVLHLNSAIVDARFGRPGAAQAHERDAGGSGLLEWLADQESEHRYIVYETDLSVSPWTERCIRQADRIVLVADAGGDAAPGELEHELLAQGPARRTPVTLALLHPPEASAPSGTARWLEGRAIERHVHVKRGRASDFERLSRFVTGNAIGLTLGGGFARGLAHVGVLRAFAEHGVPIDAIGGASMGAIVGGQWACGFDGDRIVHEMRTGLGDSFDDMTFPYLALKRGGKMSRLMQTLFGDIRIEDLWVPYFCVSANLNRAELTVHAKDELAAAVIASSRAPGIFPPIVLDGELHVDGGLIDNVPVDVMKPFANHGIVIGVDVSPPHELNQVHDYGYDVPGWRAVWNRLGPSGDKPLPPNILLVLMRVIEFGGISYRRAKAETADLYISPDVMRFSRIDFEASQEIADVGYRAAAERVAAWLETPSDALRARRPDVFGPPAR